MRSSFFSWVCAGTLLWSIPAAAQASRPERPYRGLFGGGVANTEQLLTANFSLGAAYSDNVLAEVSGDPSGPFNPDQGRSGAVGQLGGGLSYTLSRSRVGFGASIASSSRYSPDLPNRFMAAYSGSLGGTLQLGAATRVTASQTMTYQPFLTLGLFPELFDPGLGLTTPPNYELGVLRTEYSTYGTAIDFTRNVSRRAALNFNYGYQVNDFAGTDRDLTTQSAGSRFTLGLTRGLGLRVGYARVDGRFFTSQDTRHVRGHNLDVGVDFDRALSFSRRTTLSFGTGSSALVDHGRTYYRLIGHARLNHEVGRTWNAGVAYNRSLGFQETFPEPVFADSITLGVGGMVSRRLQFRSSLAAAVGDVGLSGEATGFDAYTGAAGFDFGLSRHLNLGINYSYYRYSFDREALLPPGLAHGMDRQSVQVYLSVWAPLMHRARRPDAAR